MTIELFLQLVGTVSGAMLTVSGLMLVNGLSFINQTKHWWVSDYRKLKEMTISGKLDVNELISQAAVYAQALKIPFLGITNWTDFIRKLNESQNNLECKREKIWKIWKYIVGCMGVSIISAGIGLLIQLTDDFKLVAVPSSAIFLIIGAIEFYRLAKGVYDVSKVASPTQVLLDSTNN